MKKHYNIGKDNWNYGKDHSNKKNGNYRHGNACQNKKHGCISCGKIKKSRKGNRCRSCGQKEKLISKQTKLKMSKRMTGIGNPLFGKPPSHGKRIKYKGICMRSSWEVAYAKYLDKNNWKWLYESKTFDLGNYTYTPDFYLSKDNVYVEIKGYWRDNALLKYRLFRKIYPKVRIRVLTKKSLKKLGIL